MTSSKVLEFTDPFVYQSAFRSVEVELFPTAKGEFHAELTQVSMGKLWLHAAHEDLPRVYIGAVKPHLAAIGFLTKPNQPEMQHCGMAVSPDDIIVNDADMMYRRTEANCDWGSISLAKADLETSCLAISGHEYSGLSAKHVLKPAPKLMSWLLRIHGMVDQIARATPDILSLPEAARALEQELLLVMIRCLTEGDPSRLTKSGRRHDRIIARFEEYLEVHPKRPLYLTEICAAIGVAERTLRGICEDHLGMGPIRFLALRRLHLVRRALQQANCAKTTVTRVATDHGFWELGRFSVAYRALFGETPSETLRRLPNDGPLSLSRPCSFGSRHWQH